MAMDEKAVRKALGLKDDDDIVEAIEALKKKPKMENDDNEADEEVKTELAKAREDIIRLQQESVTTKATQAVDVAIKQGRLLPVSRPTALKMALRDMGEFEEFIKTMPNVLEFGERGHQTELNASELEPTANEIALAKQMGAWSPEQRIALMRQKAEARGIELPMDFGKEKEKEEAKV